MSHSPIAWWGQTVTRWCVDGSSSAHCPTDRAVQPLGHAGYRVALTVERNRMSASRPSRKSWLTVLFLRAAAAIGTVVDVVLNLWGPGRVHGSATPPRRGPR